MPRVPTPARACRRRRRSPWRARASNGVAAPCSAARRRAASGSDQTSAYERPDSGRSKGSRARTSGARNHCRATCHAAGRRPAGRRWPAGRSGVSSARAAPHSGASRGRAFAVGDERGRHVGSSTRVTCAAKRIAASSSCSSAAASVMTASSPTRCSQAENSITGRRRRPAPACRAPACDVGRHRVPDLQLAQQPDRGRVERIGADVVARTAPAAGGSQRHRKAEARQRQGQAPADDAGAADLHVEGGRHR